jgi:hypothetical protein
MYLSEFFILIEFLGKFKRLGENCWKTILKFFLVNDSGVFREIFNVFFMLFFELNSKSKIIKLIFQLQIRWTIKSSSKKSTKKFNFNSSTCQHQKKWENFPHQARRT